ncbi:hypothetical protein ACLHDG_11050 [Sulfurovum sp. CS9]|uniref:hypothetical protein n=1 Tax=Sulfurovum sp. CS9 TaxID=3391146 RepID=UPI0039EB3073
MAVDEKGRGIESCTADVKTILHKDESKSLRPGIMPERGRRGALEVYDEIKKALVQ